MLGIINIYIYKNRHAWGNMKISNNLHWPWTAGQLSFRGAVKRNHDLDRSPEFALTVRGYKSRNLTYLQIVSLYLVVPYIRLNMCMIIQMISNFISVEMSKLKITSVG